MNSSNQIVIFYDSNKNEQIKGNFYDESKLDDSAKTGILLVTHGSRLHYNKEFATELYDKFKNGKKKCWNNFTEFRRGISVWKNTNCF